MKKLILFLFAFFLTTSCFADERVYLVSPQGELIYATDRILRTSTTGVPASLGTVVLGAGTSSIGSISGVPASLGTVVLGVGNSVIGRVYSYASGNVINPARMGNNLLSGQDQNVSSIAAVQLSGDSIITSITLTTPSTNKDYIYVGPIGVTVNNGYALATSEVLVLNVDHHSVIYYISGNGCGPNNQKLSYVSTLQATGS